MVLMMFFKIKEIWLNEIIIYCIFEIFNSSVNIFFYFLRFINDLFCMLVNFLIFIKEIFFFYNKYFLNWENILSKKKGKMKCYFN